MKPLTQDENTVALDQLIAGERQALARTRWQVQLHRDILNSPAETLTQVEAAAMKSAQAIEWLEAQREKMSTPASHNGVRVSA
jgi:hypothetical protein